MYNLRYHIASLVAVFLALALGLLLGTIVVERGVLSTQQQELIAGLQKDFDQIRQESASVKAANTALTGFSAELVPQVVASVLPSRTVLVIASPETADTAGTATSALRQAGSLVAVATFSEPGFGLKDSAVATAAATALGVAPESVSATMVAAELTREWSTGGDPRQLAKALIAHNVLKVTGLAAGDVAAGVVVACSFGGQPDSAALALAEVMSNVGRAGVGVESSAHPDGTAALAKTGGLSGVDDIDTPMGEVSLVWILAGKAKGLYGSGTGVDAAYPSPLFK